MLDASSEGALCDRSDFAAQGVTAPAVRRQTASALTDRARGASEWGATSHTRAGAQKLRSAYLGYATSWHLAVWFMAVVAPDLDRHRGARLTLYTVVMCAIAVRAGVALSYPAGFGALAFVCYSITTAKGRTISFETELGKGTTFTIRIPLLDTPASRSGKAAA